MAREKQDYRPNIELLNTLFPGSAVLTEEQAMQAIGCKDRRTLKKHLGECYTSNNRISKTALARWMCGS